MILEGQLLEYYHGRIETRCRGLHSLLHDQFYAFMGILLIYSQTNCESRSSSQVSVY